MTSIQDQDAEIIKHLRERVQHLEAENKRLQSELDQLKSGSESQREAATCPHHPNNYMADAGCPDCEEANELNSQEG